MTIDFDNFIDYLKKNFDVKNPPMIGKLNKSPFGEWWVHFHDGKSLQKIDESIDTSSFENNQKIEFEIHLASNPEFTKDSTNKYRAFPV
jgi:hypothetical protein